MKKQRREKMTDNEENMWMHQKKGCEGGKKDKIIAK